MAMTPEQLKALLEISGSDIGGLEDEQTRQIALANSMRGQMMRPAGPRDWGQNVANAGYGIGGALNDYRAGQAQPAISAAKKSTFANIIAGLSGKKKEVGMPEQLGTPAWSE